MSAKSNANTCLSLLMKLQTFSPNDKNLEEAVNLHKPANIPGVIDELGRSHFESIENYAQQSILKPLGDHHDKFIILVHQDGSASSEPNVLSALSALAYDKGDTACLEEIADQYQHHEGVSHLMNNLGVMFSEKMDYKRSETCFTAAKRCFEQQLDNLGSAVASLNLAFLHKMFGNSISALLCSDAAAALCHDISMRTTKYDNLPGKVLRRVSGLCQEVGNYKKFKDVLHIGVCCSISGTDKCLTDNLTKQLMTLQLKEQNGEKSEAEELKDLASHLFELLDQSCTDNLPKTELINADFITIVITVVKMHRDLGSLEEGCKLLEKLKTTSLLVLGGRCSLYGALLYQIGSFYLGTGKATEARSSLKLAEEIFIHYCGKDHHMVASCKSLLGTCSVVNGKTREASTYLNEALVLFKKINHHHPEVGEILLKLAVLSSEEGNFESAKKTLHEALDIFVTTCGEVSPGTGSAFLQAAFILQKENTSRASAVDIATRALDIFLQLGLKDNHPDVMACRNLLGVLQLSLGRGKEAEERFSEVQQQIALQDDPCLTTRILTPERSNMFFQVKNDCGTDCSFMGHSLGAEVVSLANLVAMKKEEERRNHLNTLLTFLQGHETKELLWDFAGQTVYYIAHRVWSSDRFVYCILISAPSSRWLQSGCDQNPNFEEPNVFLLSSSNGHAKNPSSIVFWKTTKVLEMKELSKVNSAFRESVNLLFLQPKFRKGYLQEQDFYMELTLPHDPRASLCSQIDFLPLLVTQELSDPHEECDSINSVSLFFAGKPSAHVSYFTYRLSSQRQAMLVFDNLVLSLGQALAKVGGEEISCVPALQNGAFFFFLKPSNSSLSVVVENESVHVKCRTVKDSESSCICSLVRNALEGTIRSLCCVIEVAFNSSMQLPCDGENMRECSCGCRDSQIGSTSSNSSLDTLDARAHVRIQEPESDYNLKGKPSTEVLQNDNESEEDIPFAGRPDTKISTEVCVSFLDCLLSNRHVSPEVQSSDTHEMSLSFDSPCLDDNPQLDSSLLSPGSMTSLNSLPTSPANAENENPFVQIRTSSWPNMAVELCNEKDCFNTDCLSENSSTACVGCSESPLLFHAESSNSARDSLPQDCSATRSSSHEKDLPSGENVSDVETTETVQLEGSTRLREDKTQALESEVAFYLNQNYELRQQVAELEEKLKQHDIEKQQIELELGIKSFFEDKQKRSKKILRSFSEQNNSSAATGASYAFNGVEGKLLGGASPLHEPGISLQRRLLEISNSLSEAELDQMKFLVRPKVSGLRLKKIREGYQLFEELETNREFSCVYVRELLEGIQRFDLAEKLDLPSSDNAERGKRNKDEDACSASSSAILPPRNKKLGVLSKRLDGAADKTSLRIHQQGSEGNNNREGNSGNTRHDVMVLPLNANCCDSSQQSGSSSEELTCPTDSSNGGFLSTESCSTTVSSSELSTNSSAMAGPLTDDSTASSCTSQDVTVNLPSAVKNCERSDAEDSSYNSRSSQEESLQRSLLPDNSESASGDMHTVEAFNSQDERTSEMSESSQNGLIETFHVEIRCAAGAGTDFVDSGTCRSPDRVRSGTNSGLMKDALPDGDISVRSDASSGERYSAVNDSVTEISTQSNEWEHLGARPKNRPPVKRTPPASSLVDLVPQEVAGPVANGVANGFLARHSQDKGLHESLYHNNAEKVNTSSLGASYVDGMMNQSERNKAKPYLGDCQADVHSGLFPFASAGYINHNAVSCFSYNGQFSSQTGLVPGPQYSNFPGSNGNLLWSSAFNSSSNSSLRSDFELGSGRPFGMGSAVGFPSGMTGSYFGSGSVGMGATDPQMMPPAAFGAQRYSLFNENTSTMGSEHDKTQTPWATYSGLANQSNVMANSAPTRNVSHADVCLGSGGLPAPSTIGGSSGADNRHGVDDESSGTSHNALGTTRSNVLSSSGHHSVAGADGNTEADLPSSQYAQLLAAAYARENGEPQGASSTAGSMLNRDFGTDSVESTDNSLLALEQRVEEACALVERVLREREEREQFGREIERKEREIREQRARKRREREARELEEANRWPHQQEAITGRSQWLCEHYQRHCRVRFPCCTHFYPCHRCHNNSKACDNEEAKASHATHLKCSLCHHEQEIDEESGKCGSCGAQMSAYFCSICKHFTSVDKNPYHCEKCGICRIHKDKSFHCEVCNVCLDKRLEGKHKCRPDSGHDECCICLEDAFSGCQILPCSHKVHRECAIAMIQNGIRTCPVCRHPLYSPAPE